MTYRLNRQCLPFDCNSQLKFLYVAITRSRKNLWIVDCSDKAEPMKVS